MRPMFRILADGADVTAAIRDRLIELRVTDEAGTRSDAVGFTLDDRDGEIALPRHGAELSVSLGYREAGLTWMGLYVVDEVEVSGWPRRLGVRAKAADMRRSLKAPKTRSWDEVTLADLVSTIAAEHGLSPRVAETLATHPFSHLDQTNESDLHFLTRLARDLDAVAKPAGGGLVIVPRGEARSVSGRTLPTVAMGPGDLTNYRATIADRGRYTAVRAFWHDQAAARDVEVLVGMGEPVFTLRHPFPDAAQATTAAKGKLDALQRGESVLSVTTPGRPDLAAEGKLTIAGVRSGVDGTWVITKAEHLLDGQGGYRTEVEAEVPKK